MIELTEQQAQALEHPDSTPPRLIHPRTKETFVLLRVDKYQRLTEEYDDSPWTREELQALAWERVKHEDWDEYDDQDVELLLQKAPTTDLRRFELGRWAKDRLLAAFEAER
jgi:hypothetical protein